jgi:hypothetical protein
MRDRIEVDRTVESRTVAKAEDKQEIFSREPNLRADFIKFKSLRHDTNQGFTSYVCLFSGTADSCSKADVVNKQQARIVDYLCVVALMLAKALLFTV